MTERPTHPASRLTAASPRLKELYVIMTVEGNVLVTVIFWGIIGIIGLILWHFGGWLAVRWGAFVFILLCQIVLMMGAEGSEVVFDVTKKGKRGDAIATLLIMVILLTISGFLTGRFLLRLF